ncbi:TetR/AcrR family transcriptional regulator C-terminal domain-containing protein [Paenibacillus athensensis]|uniref:TetR family transcriptional regulator n=1 Tax=Paenibacillus athensensis TaxID=1967502 RepID=A0A4Y8PV55_9BACL|nr:TetR/AcrR family transcriptional regulator [Paenibacillus athensensis]MCD1261851.1 TetR/AcrR family transcriptional regulator C-terminal domain-containing protein [Paenibacillus athensensis]
MSQDEMTPEEAAKLLPAGAALGWGLGKLPQRGPKREMSIAQIVQKAMEIADKDGLAAVSMNRVASELGFTAMSLYRYIPSKDDLLMLMQEAACELQLPPQRAAHEWRESMREYVLGTVEVFRKHPWYGDIPIFGIPLTPNNLRIVDWALRPLQDMPLNDYEKMSIVLLLSGYARTCGMLQRDIDSAVRAGSSEKEFGGLGYSAALRTLVKPEQFPHLYPMIQSGAYTDEHEGQNTVGDDMEFGLARILDGIEHYLNGKKSGGGIGS